MEGSSYSNKWTSENYGKKNTRNGEKIVDQWEKINNSDLTYCLQFKSNCLNFKYLNTKWSFSEI